MDLVKAFFGVFGSIGRLLLRAITRAMPIEHRVREAKGQQSDRVKKMARGESQIETQIQKLIAMSAAEKTSLARLSGEVDQYLKREELARKAVDVEGANAYAARAAEVEQELQRLTIQHEKNQANLLKMKGMNRQLALQVDYQSSKISQMEIRGAFVLGNAARKEITDEIAKAAEEVLGLSGVSDAGVESMEEIEAQVEERANGSQNYVNVLERLAKNRGLEIGSSAAQDDVDVMSSIAARKARLNIKSDSQQDAAS